MIYKLYYIHSFGLYLYHKSEFQVFYEIESIDSVVLHRSYEVKGPE